MNSNKPDTTNGPSQQTGDNSCSRFGSLATDALRYWEPRRWIYNAALLIVVVAHFGACWPEARRLFSPDSLLQLFVVAVLANVAYCAAYAIDIFVQFSALRASWLRGRWVVLLLGTALGAVIAHFMMMGFLHGPVH